MRDKNGKNLEVGHHVKFRRRGKWIRGTVRTIIAVGEEDWFAWVDDGKPEIANPAKNGMRIRAKVDPQSIQRVPPPKPVTGIALLRKTYKVPAKRGMAVEIDGKRYKVTSSDGQHLVVDGKHRFHPTADVVYFDKYDNVLLDTRKDESAC